MAVNNNMIYTRVCVDCGKVMHNVGRRAERCPECRAVHIRVKALEASYRERTEQLIRQQEERAEAIHQGLVDDNERFTASAGTYGKDLGADVKFGKPASETQHSPALQRLTA